jgi:hypothetical protein
VWCRAGTVHSFDVPGAQIFLKSGRPWPNLVSISSAAPMTGLRPHAPCRLHWVSKLQSPGSYRVLVPNPFPASRNEGRRNEKEKSGPHNRALRRSRTLLRFSAPMPTSCYRFGAFPACTYSMCGCRGGGGIFAGTQIRTLGFSVCSEPDAVIDRSLHKIDLINIGTARSDSLKNHRLQSAHRGSH